MKKRVVNIIVVSIGALIILMGLLFLYKKGFSIPCIFHEMTSLYCPGCGMTRSIASLLDGNIQLALQNNILIIFTPLIPIYLILITRHYIVYGEKLVINIPKYIMYGLLIVIIIFAIVRNLPGFDYLLPIS